MKKLLWVKGPTEIITRPVDVSPNYSGSRRIRRDRWAVDALIPGLSMFTSYYFVVTHDCLLRHLGNQGPYSEDYGCMKMTKFSCFIDKGKGLKLKRFWFIVDPGLPVTSAPCSISCASLVFSPAEGSCWKTQRIIQLIDEMMRKIVSAKKLFRTRTFNIPYAVCINFKGILGSTCQLVIGPFLP